MGSNWQSLSLQNGLSTLSGVNAKKVTLVLTLLILIICPKRISSAFSYDENAPMDDFFDLREEISPEEYHFLHGKIKTNHNGNRFLLGWPTIPVPYKGSDSRALDAIRFLNNVGYKVDLIFWRDFATELGDPNHDDKPDRLKLAEAGVQNIYGPYDKKSLSDSDKGSIFSNYFAFIFWIWPDGPYLECLHDFVNHVKTLNGFTHIIAAVDDIGVAVRLLYSMDMKKENTENKNLTNIENFLLVNKRHPDLLGMEADNFVQNQPPSITFKDGLFSPIYLFHLEIYLYAMADASVGLNGQIREYLEKMVPGTPSRCLSYLSSAQPDETISPIPFERRRDYLFFGYQNTANIELLQWIHKNVFDQIDVENKFHIAGMVTANATDFCKCLPKHPNECISSYKNVVCHGPISDDELETLIRNVKVTINTVLEPSGVATKTCRSLAFGTPTVVSELDGTFDDDEKVNSGAKICGVGDPACVVESIETLLSDEDEWNLGAKLGPTFISTHYGPGKYVEDWIDILTSLYAKKVEVLIYGDANFHGSYSDLNNWYIANMLSNISEYNVTVLGKMDVVIDGVTRVDKPSSKPKRLSPENLGGFFRVLGHSSFESPFETGFQANIILRKNWPSENIFPLNFCGVGCRVTQMLSLEFGSMPESLIPTMKEHIDWLWVPTLHAQNVFGSTESNLNFDSKRTAIVNEGIDCSSIVKASYSTATNEKKVVFIFTGDMIPSNGIDIILEEWNDTFCENSQAKLILLTKYELGYSRTEIEKMTEIKEKCMNIEWRRNIEINQEENMSQLVNADVFLGIFRSEVSGFHVVEAMAAGLSVITSVGETLTDKYFELESDMKSENMFSHTLIYPVSSSVSTCTHYPCLGDLLCVFPPCTQSSKGDINCTCKKLIEEPVWLDIDRKELRAQMIQTFEDKREEKFLQKTKKRNFKRIWETKNCWSNLKDHFIQNISVVIKTKRIREVQKYEIIRPRSRKQMRQFWKTIRLLLVGTLLISISFPFWKKHFFELKRKMLMKTSRLSRRRLLKQNSMRKSFKRFRRLHED